MKKEPMIIIGLVGKQGSGKDTAADFIIEALAPEQTIVRLAFADPLRDEVAAAFEVDAQWLKDPVSKDMPSQMMTLSRCRDHTFAALAKSILNVPMHHPLSARQVLRLWGTEYRRGSFTGYWTSAVQAQLAYATANNADFAVITDVRFMNEARILKYNGAQLWRIVRPELEYNTADFPRPIAHKSETEQDAIVVDAQFTNASLDQFRYAIRSKFLGLQQHA